MVKEMTVILTMIMIMTTIAMTTTMTYRISVNATSIIYCTILCEWSVRMHDITFDVCKQGGLFIR